MSTVVSNERRIWLPLLASIALIAGGIVAVLNLPTSVTGLSLTAPATPATVDQAPWKIGAKPAGALGKIRPKQEKYVIGRAPAIRALIRDVYDAAFLDQASLKSVLKKNFIDSAAAALLKARVGFPKNASDIKTLRRQAWVDIEVAGATHAAASVHVLARATVGERKVKVAHRSLLWLERGKDGWRVIAFEVEQRPAA